MVRMRHPKLPPEQTIDVPESAVLHHQRSGWEVIPEEPPSDQDSPPLTEETTAEAPAGAGASALPDQSLRRRRTRGDDE